MKLRRVISLCIVLAMLSGMVGVPAVPVNSVTYYDDQPQQSVPAEKGKDAAPSQCGEDLTWTLDEEGTLTISGTGDMWNLYLTDVPWYEQRETVKKVIIENGVTGIGEYAFGNCGLLTEVVMSETVTRIGSYAFSNCRSLTQITIPGSVTSIEIEAFKGCNALADVFGSDITRWCKIDFGSNASNPLYNGGNLYFNGELVTDLVIPEGITRIGSYAFSHYAALKTVTIADSVLDIGDCAFSNCVGLTEVTLGSGLRSIGEDAFQSCDQLQYHIYEECRYLGSDENPYALLVKANSQERNYYTIHADTTIIYNHAFYGCYRMTNIKIPEKVISIGASAFASCHGLQSITIPDSVKIIDDYAFDNCDELYDVHLGTGLISLGGAAFAYCTALESIEIPGSVMDVVGSTFANCSNLSRVTFADGNVHVGDYAFSGCGNLNSVTFGDGETVIDNYVFDGCRNLTTVDLGSGNVIIGDYAFRQCTKLTGITFVNGAEIGDYAFYSCSSLADLTFGDGETIIGERAFESCRGLTSLVLPDGVTTIGDTAFVFCSNLTTVTIGKGIVNMGDSVFNNCTKLTDCHISDLTAWCQIEFGTPSSNPSYYAKNLYLNGELITELVIPEGVTAIGDYTFAYCTDLTKVVIPESVKKIGDSAFYYCSSLSDLTIGEDVCEIGEYAFFRCSALTRVVIPDSVEVIGDYAFSKCTALTSIGIGTGLCSVGAFAFYECSNLRGVYISDAGAWCSIAFEMDTANPFYHGANLYLNNVLVKELVIPRGVTVIKDNAFANALGLVGITIPNTVTHIGNRAFSNCRNLVDVSLPDSVEWVGMYAFLGCNKLNYAGYDNGLYLGSTENPFVYLMKGQSNGITACQIHKDTRIIGCAAFYGYASLSAIVIPDEVRMIGYQAFSGCTGLQELSIGSNVKIIDDEAFYGCRSLAEVVLPEGLETLDASVFSGCTSLNSISVPHSLTTLGQYAFSNCTALQYSVYDNARYLGNAQNPYLILVAAENKNITSCDIHYATKFIYSHAFSQCKNLTGIVIPGKVKSIGAKAFSDCTSLKDVTIPASVTEIGESAFYRCTGLTNLYVSDLEAWCNIDFADGTANPGAYASKFYCNGKWITAFVIPEHVTEIKDYTFYSSAWMNAVVIPQSVTSVGISAFEECDYLWHVLYKGTEDRWEQIIQGTGNEALSNTIRHTACEGDEILDPVNKVCVLCCEHVMGEPVVVPPTCKEEGYTATVCILCGHTRKEQFVPTGDHSFGQWITDRESTCVTPGEKYRICTVCGISERADLPTVIHTYDIVINDATCTEPGSKVSTCTVCGHVETVLIPAKGHTFNHVVTKPTCQAEGYTTHTCHCGYSYVDLYTDKIAHNYKNDRCTYCGDIRYAIVDTGTCGDNLTWKFDTFGVLTISGSGPMWDFSASNGPGWEFYAMRAKEVVIEEGVTTIGSYAFSSVWQITSVTMADTVTHIYAHAFATCDSLAEIVLSENLAYIGASAFSGCSALQYTNYNNGKYLGSRTNPYLLLYKGSFAGTSFSVHSDTKLIAPSAFSSSRNLTDVQLGENLQYIGVAAFSGCASLQQIYIPEGVKVIDDRAFNNCSKLRFVSIPESVTSIGEDVFKDTRNLNIFYAGTVERAEQIGLTAATEGVTSANAHFGVTETTISGQKCYYCTECSRYILPNGTVGTSVIRFVDWDGSVLSQKTYEWGAAIVPPEAPTRLSDGHTVYTFIGWDDPVTVCTGAATFTAQYTSTATTYRIVFKNWDGTILSDKTYHYGDKVTAPANPARPADSSYTYTFTGWDKTVVNCAGNATYTAVYSSKSKAPSSITSSAYTVSGEMVRKITAGTTVATFLSKFNESAYMAVYNGSQKVSGNTLVGTGMVIKLMDGSTVKATYTIVVTGDTNGDGKISVTDMLAVKSHVLQKSNLTGAAALAADTNKDGGISVTDFIQIKAYILEKGTITPN